MELRFDRFHQITGNSSAQALEEGARLLKNYLSSGTSLIFGRSSGKWFWSITLPISNTALPSAVSVLNNPDSVAPPAFQPTHTWYILHNRTLGKDPSVPFHRTLHEVLDLPLESLFSCLNSDFIVHVNLPGQTEMVQGLRDSALKVQILSNQEIVINRLGQWLDCRAYPFDPRRPDNSYCLVGLSEIYYLIRVPIYSDTFLPHLEIIPNDVVAYLKKNPNALMRNLLIGGLPGSGKTTTLKTIVAQVLAVESLKSILVVDVKGEYETWCKLHQVNYLAAGRNPLELKQLKINPFIPSAHLRLATHIDLLATLLGIGSFGGGGILLPSYLKFLLEEWYLSFLLPLLRLGAYPADLIDQRLLVLNMTGKELMQRLNGQKTCFQYANFGLIHFWRTRSNSFVQRVFGAGALSNGRAEVLDVISSRIASFETSLFQSFDYENGDSIDHMLSQRWCLGFNGLSKDSIQLLASILLTLSVETLMAGPEATELNHLFLIEEAHLVASRTADSDELMTVSKLVGDVIERALCEARSKGVGLILTDQQPGTRLLPTVLANTNLKVCHNLLGLDGERMAQAMGLPLQTCFSNLEVGHAYVKLGDHLPTVQSRIHV